MKRIMALTGYLLLTGCSTMRFPPMVFLHPVTGSTGDCPGRTITAYTPSDRKAEVTLQDRCVRTWLAAGYMQVK
jgi:hypothetical protein